ncbi:hypothetical protein SAMN04488070_1481 [Pseudidiomarina maritima]|jgi:hypothetical protein|uniref:Uncharacterized protein n=1 Tax=Pseudidiomarina maritima TaxID=519453 RepID=A0A1I6H560_9GAMM|nr:hypothetical protein SAMN04488070_1481 [Pseudidiomarina maritima]
MTFLANGNSYTFIQLNQFIKSVRDLTARLPEGWHPEELLCQKSNT